MDGTLGAIQRERCAPSLIDPRVRMAPLMDSAGSEGHPHLRYKSEWKHACFSPEALQSMHKPQQATVAQ